MNAELSLPRGQDKQQSVIEQLSPTNNSLKNKIGRITASSLMVVSSALAIFTADEARDPTPAYAETVSALNGFVNNYPYLHAVVRNASTYDWWIDENRNGVYNSGESHSPLNYYYRNCTDGAAFWAQSYLGVNVSGWGNAKNWNETAASRYMVKPGNANSVEPGDIAQSDDGTYGHVGFVTEVIKNDQGEVTKIKVAELNKDGKGNFTHDPYSTKNSLGKFIRSTGRDWDHFIDLNGVSVAAVDTDKDGFADNVDKCPKIAGSIEGCPDGQPLVSVIRSFTGGDTAYARGADGRLYTSWQTSPGSNWEGWVPLGNIPIAGAPTAINAENGAHAVFVRGNNGRAYTTWQTEAGSDQWLWADLGGDITSNIQVNDAVTGGKVIFARNSRGELVHSWQAGPGTVWGEWVSLGGNFVGDPSVIRTPDGAHVAYVRGTNNRLLTRWQIAPGGSWSDWHDLGGNLTSSPVATWASHGGMVIFARDEQGRISHKWQLAPGSGSWSDWVPLTGKTLSASSVMKETNGSLSIYYANENGVLMTDWQSAPGSTWNRASLGTTVVGTPSVVRAQSGVLSEFAPDSEGTVRTMWQTTPGSNWIGGVAIGNNPLRAW